MKRLCLNMIVRNESARIERCLSSLIDHISCAVIADTGSTDDTVERIDSFLDAHGVPYSIIAVPFENFSQARNAALEAAQMSSFDYDYVLLADADMELKVRDSGWREALGNYPAHTIAQRSGSLFYPNTRLLRRDVHARYVGSTHEYLDVSARNIPESVVWYEDHADGSNREGKFERDIRLLKEDIKKDPNNGRAWFYLGQSYREAGRFQKAMEAYRKRVMLGGWEEETWFAQLMVGECLKKLGDEAGFIRETLAAYNLRPQRLEALYELAEHYRHKGDNANAVLFAKAGLGRAMPGDLLFLNEYAYKAGLAEEFSIAGFYLLDEREQAFEACNRLALDKQGYDSSRQLARSNLFHYLCPLATMAPSFRSHEIQFAPPPGYVPMNPSVCRGSEHLWTTVRCVNYTITPEGRYAIRGDDDTINDSNPINTRTFLLALDEGLAPMFAREIETVSSDEYKLVRGWEDMRLYWDYDQLGVSATVREGNRDGWCEQYRGYVNIKEDKYLVGAATVMSQQGRHEKNWMPTPDGKFIYELGHVKDRDGVTVAVTDVPFCTDGMRGGSQLIVFRGGHLAVIHEAIYRPDGHRAYQHRFVFFDHEYRPLRVSLPFVFHDKQIEFAAGLCWHKDMKRLVISYGVRDCEARLATVDAHEVAEMVGLV